MRHKRILTVLAMLLACSVPAILSAQIDVGNSTLTGEAALQGLPMDVNGSRAKFEEYRDIPETLVVPEIRLELQSKKNDYYMNFETLKPGLDDQYYQFRFGKYGLFDMEFQWDQIPHIFSERTAKTPYLRSNDGGLLNLSSRPTPTGPLSGGLSTYTSSDVQNWVNQNAHFINLGLLQGIGRFTARYTPSPGWTFTGTYWSQHTTGKRALGAMNGSSPGSFNITELVEPIDYQTHNIELGGEYAGNGWSVGLKYNGSLFHNSVSTLIWDNPIHRLTGGVCVDSGTYNNSTGTGNCQSRMDLYPSNQAHTFTLSGAVSLPWKSKLMSTMSYGWRLQSDDFLPFTINSALAGYNTKGFLPASNLNGDVRPAMINTTFVNNYFDKVNLKATYRFYDLNNRSKSILLSNGLVVNDVSAGGEAGERSIPYQYSKSNLNFEAGYDPNRWITPKLNWGWERLHHSVQDVVNQNEFSAGPTVDIKPNTWILLRASYKHFWRDAPDYNNNRNEVFDTANVSRKFYLAKRDRDKASLFAQFTPFEKFTFYAGFEATSDEYHDTQLGVDYNSNYSPSIGLTYTPLDWLRLFLDYNWDRSDWKLNAMQRSSTTQTTGACATGVAANQLCWASKQRDIVNTVSLGGDADIIKDLLLFRLQYSISPATSKITASGDPGGGLPNGGASDYPTVRNTWQELLARLEYKFHKNVSFNLGYYFNRFDSRDFGLDIMQPWMDSLNSTADSAGAVTNVSRSIFLGDNIKKPYVAHVGVIGVKFSF